MQKILIVDDIAVNIKILSEILNNATTDFFFATDGITALEIAASIIPDLIILDIMMPEMDGYEVCKRLKAEVITQNIPVIFLTTLDDDDDEAKGLALGVVDYINKPIRPAIVLARVNTHLKLKQARDEVVLKNIALEETAKLRDGVEHIIRHDLKTPINGIIGFARLLLEKEFTLEKQNQFLQMIENAGYQMLKLLNNSYNLYKMEMGKYQYQPDRMNLLPVLEKIIIETQSHASFQDLNVKMMLNDQLVTEKDTFFVVGEQLLCYAMFANLFKNAIEASPEGAVVTISLMEKDNPTVSIHNQGAVPKEIRDKFFDRYITSGKFGGTGLGTYSAKLMAETQGGSIQFETSEELGTTVTVVLQYE